MEHAPKDRRIRRSQQLLQNALLALLKEKRYEDISVQEIIERADVARSTFYVHYVDKDDLLVGSDGIFAGGLQHQMSSAVHAVWQDPSALSSLGWFYHVRAQKDVLKIIAKDQAIDLAMKTMHNMMRRDMQERLEAHLRNQTDLVVPVSVFADYLAVSLMVLLKWWVQQDMPQPPERMDELFQQLVTPGLLAMLNKQPG